MNFRIRLAIASLAIISAGSTSAQPSPAPNRPAPSVAPAAATVPMHRPQPAAPNLNAQGALPSAVDPAHPVPPAVAPEMPGARPQATINTPTNNPFARRFPGESRPVDAPQASLGLPTAASAPAQETKREVEEEVVATRIGVVNGMHIYRGTSAYEFESSEKLIVKRQVTSPVKSQTAKEGGTALPSTVGSRSPGAAPPVPSPAAAGRPAPSGSPPPAAAKPGSAKPVAAPRSTTRPPAKAH